MSQLTEEGGKDKYNTSAKNPLPSSYIFHFRGESQCVFATSNNHGESKIFKSLFGVLGVQKSV
jgi:hypothetical protein